MTNVSRSTHSGITRPQIRDYQAYLRIFADGVWKGLFRMDLHSISGIGRDALRALVHQELGILARSPKLQAKGLERLNHLYATSIHEMEHTFRLPIPPQIKAKKSWASIEEFLDFIYEHASEQSGYAPVVRCALLKTMSRVNFVLGTYDFDKLDASMSEVLDRVKSMPWFVVREYDDDSQDLYFDNGLELGEQKRVSGRMQFRTKRFSSTLLKHTYNRKYLHDKPISDMLAFRVEIDDADGGKDHRAEVLDYFVRHLFERRCECEHKGKFISKKALTDLGIPIADHGEKHGTTKRHEAKLVGKVTVVSGGKPVDRPVEIQFVYTGNKNESGLKRHEVYDAKKILTADTHLLSALPISQVKRVVNGIICPLDSQHAPIHPNVVINHLLFPREDQKGSERWFIAPVQNGKFFVSQDALHPNLANLYEYPVFQPLDYNGFWSQYDSVPAKKYPNKQ